MGGRRVLEGGLTITEVVVLHGDCIGRRNGACELPMSMQRALLNIAIHRITGIWIAGRPCSIGR